MKGKQITKTYSEEQIENALSTGKPTIKELFLDENVSDEDLFRRKDYVGQILMKFIGLSDAEGKTTLGGKCFIGVNVKTSSSEPLNPISFRTTEKKIDYKADPSSIPVEGRITSMNNPEQELSFLWNPGKWSYEEEIRGGKYDVGGYSGAVRNLDGEEYGNSEVIKMFKSPFGRNCNPSTSQEKKYNILGDIYYNALGMTKGECWVWIYHFDFDIDTGKYLSFVLAVGDNMKDYEKLMGNGEKKKGQADSNEEQSKDTDGNSSHFWDNLFGRKKSLTSSAATNQNPSESPRNMLRNYIMLVKARYVRKLERQRQVESVKSSVAAIMSRNMSHNLGSHYLYYTKTQLASLADKQEQFGPDIRGAAKVLGYMQARMDYLATIVSGDKYPYGGVFFKGQIFDELTIDDFSKRHFKDSDSERGRKFKRTTNYLLQNLILSENFTRGPVVEIEGQKNLLEEGNKLIRMQVKLNDKEFTGIPDEKHENAEEQAKLMISKITIALPGGIMSIHAFYNVLENLIRNAAKYRKDEFKTITYEKEDPRIELVITIAIRELPKEEDKSGRLLPIRYQFVIYDNKANAFEPCSAENSTTLVDQMNQELRELIVWDNKKNELDKSNKGLKEMLFSTLWMRAYTYNKSETLSDILAQFDRMPIDSDDEDLARKAREDKWREIKQHAFEYVAVDDDGNVQEDVEGKALNTGKPSHLGIRFELPKYRMMENVDAEKMEGDFLIEKGLNNFTDIICIDPKSDNIGYLKSKFTRVYDEGRVENEDDSNLAVAVLRKILTKRFPGFNEYRLSIGSTIEKGFSENTAERGIYFWSHFDDMNIINDYAYCEAISGENFTKTMENIFKDSFKFDDDGQPIYRDADSEYFALKIKESALTRITLVDERLYKEMKATKNKDEFLKHKNIRVLNLKSDTPGPLVKDDGTIEVTNMFDCNDFRDYGNATHFLSIHLGMIEKIVKDDSAWVKERGLENASMAERVDDLMKTIKQTFKTSNGELFISIHSGRGNFSKELDESLREYPFISISALEAVYANSKFLLGQLFYNTVYIGKGVANSQNAGKEVADGRPK